MAGEDATLYVERIPYISGTENRHILYSVPVAPALSSILMQRFRLFQGQCIELQPHGWLARTYLSIQAASIPQTINFLFTSHDVTISFPRLHLRLCCGVRNADALLLFELAPNPTFQNAPIRTEFKYSQFRLKKYF